MRTMQKIVRGAALVSALGVSALAQAQTTPIQFNPNGTGAAGAVAVATFDWKVNSAIARGGNPAAGLAAGSKVVVLSQAKLSTFLDSGGNTVAIPPAGTEFTFVAGFGETVVSCSGASCASAAFVVNLAEATNFFEIWVKTAAPFANNLAGTGFNTSKRIFFGKVTDASGNFSAGTCPGGSVVDFDQAGNNDWPGELTICGSGSTDISVQVLSLDPDYFPGFGPAQIDSLKAFFNTSTVTPFRQTDPARRFIADDAGATGTDAQPAVVPNLAAINGVSDGTNRDFEFQADANQAFQPGVEVPGACRVTYGGNDKNGNITPNSFGEACSADKNNTQNCYTFGGQVGAPTANPAFGGPFGEHTHHQVQGPAGDFVFRAGTHSAPSNTRITATACKDPGACQAAAANASFKQIDFEGTGSFRTLSAQAVAYLKSKGAVDPQPDNASTRTYYFRVDMDDFGEPGNKSGPKGKAGLAWANLLAADQNRPLSDPDPLMSSYGACNDFADVYQFYICKDEQPCEQAQAIYAVRGFLTGGNIQLHKVIK
jgi:hypothetical protein